MSLLRRIRTLPVCLIGVQRFDIALQKQDGRV
jgi:hypothetical protein